jgi:phenol 2-monooxygenase (NADPH)
VRRFTPAAADYDSIFNILLVLSGKRKEVQQEEIPEPFTPTTGKWEMKCTLFPLSHLSKLRADSV